MVISHAPTVMDDQNLRHELLPRISDLRRYVNQKIPKRFRRTISADDILQEVWIAAFRTAATFVQDGPGAIDRWLMTIANTKLIDATRLARATRRGGSDALMRSAHLSSCRDLFAQIQSPHNTPSGEFLANEIAHATNISLKCLTPDRRTAIELRFIEGLSPVEIARRMAKSTTAVHSLLFHGLRTLRLLMGEASSYLSGLEPLEEHGSSEHADF